MNYANMKIYFDGGHYVGIPQGAFPSGKGCKRRAVKPMKQQSTAEVMPPEPPKERFETAYKESQSLPKRERKAHIKAALKDDFADKTELSAFVDKHTERMKTNAIKRKEKLTDIEKRLTIEKSQTAFRLSKEQIIDYYKSALEKEPLQLINYFIKEIQLYDDKMIIIYNTPKTINLDESQGFSFCDKNVKRPYVIQNRKYYGLKEFRLIMRI